MRKLQCAMESGVTVHIKRMAGQRSPRTALPIHTAAVHNKLHHDST